MYLIKVDDGFVEWAFELEGSDEYSIQDIVDVICKNTNLQVVKPAQQSVQADAGKPHVGIPCVHCGAVPSSDVSWVCQRR